MTLRIPNKDKKNCKNFHLFLAGLFKRNAHFILPLALVCILLTLAVATVHKQNISMGTKVPCVPIELTLEHIDPLNNPNTTDFYGCFHMLFENGTTSSLTTDKTFIKTTYTHEEYKKTVHDFRTDSIHQCTLFAETATLVYKPHHHKDHRIDLYVMIVGLCVIFVGLLVLIYKSEKAFVYDIETYIPTTIQMHGMTYSAALEDDVISLNDPLTEDGTKIDDDDDDDDILTIK